MSHVPLCIPAPSLSPATSETAPRTVAAQRGDGWPFPAALSGLCVFCPCAENTKCLDCQCAIIWQAEQAGLQGLALASTTHTVACVDANEGECEAQ